MKDEVKLIYFYQLGAEGFKTGDRVDNPKYRDIIIKATEYSNDLHVYQFRLQKLTPQMMSIIMLKWLRGQCSI